MTDILMPEGPAYTISIADMLIRFMIGSSILFAGAYWLEKYANSPRIGSFIWKTATLGSLLLFMPQLSGVQTDFSVPSIHLNPINIFVEPQVSPVDKGIEISSLPLAEQKQTIVTTNPANRHKLPNLNGGIETFGRLALAVGILASLIIALGLAKLIMGYRRAAILLRAGSRVDAEHPVNLLLKKVSDAAKLKQKPDLYISHAIASPLTSFGRKIFFPEKLFHKLDMREVEVILCHEVAHIRQRDLIWLGLCRILQKAFIFQPLFRHAVRKIEYYAELAADEWAARQLQDSKLVANMLYQCAIFQQEQKNQNGKSVIQPEAPLAGIYLHKDESVLLKRIKNLLRQSGKTDTTTSVQYWPGGLFAVLLIGAIYATPLIHWGALSVPDCTDPKYNTETSQCYVHIENLRTISAYGRGSITLNDQYDGVTDLTLGGSLTFVDKGTFRKERYLNIRKTSEGLLFDYRVGHKPQIMDQNARKWLKQALFFTVLGDGYTAPVRVPYLLEQGGLPMVIEEMNHLKTNFAVENYKRALQEALSEKHVGENQEHKKGG